MKSHARRIIYLVVVILFTITSIQPVPVLAAEGRTARIYDYSNEVTVTRGKSDLKAFKGMRLKEGDTIKTGKNSNAYIEIDSDKVVKLDSSTIVTISNMNGTDKDGNINISLTSGKIYNDIKKKLTKNSTYKVRTPNAVMGVRGTTFVVDMKTLKDDSSKTILTVFDGTVAFAPSEQEDQNVYVKMNQTANTSDLTEEEKPVVKGLDSKDIGTFELTEIVKDTELQQNLNKLLHKENTTLDEVLKRAQAQEKELKEQKKEQEKELKDNEKELEKQNKKQEQDKNPEPSNSNSNTKSSIDANENAGTSSSKNGSVNDSSNNSRSNSSSNNQSNSSNNGQSNSSNNSQSNSSNNNQSNSSNNSQSNSSNNSQSNNSNNSQNNSSNNGQSNGNN